MRYFKVPKTDLDAKKFPVNNHDRIGLNKCCTGYGKPIENLTRNRFVSDGEGTEDVLIVTCPDNTTDIIAIFPNAVEFFPGQGDRLTGPEWIKPEA